MFSRFWTQCVPVSTSIRTHRSVGFCWRFLSSSSPSCWGGATYVPTSPLPYPDAVVGCTNAKVVPCTVAIRTPPLRCTRRSGSARSRNPSVFDGRALVRTTTKDWGDHALWVPSPRQPKLRLTGQSGANAGVGVVCSGGTEPSPRRLRVCVSRTIVSARGGASQ